MSDTQGLLPSNMLMGSPDQSKIIPALVAAQGEMPMIGFDANNPFFKSRYASLGAVIGGTRPVLAKHGLGIIQLPVICSSTVSIRSVILHSSGQWLEGGTMERQLDEESAKNPLQDAGSIITYCKRYAWSAICGVYSDEDQDGNDAPKAPAKAPAADKADPAMRMRALNQLQSAPGQPNRDIFTAFLRYKGWIEDADPEGLPEKWSLAHIPTTIGGLRKLAAEVVQWDTDRHQPAEGVTP